MHVPVPNIPLIIASQRLFQQTQAGLHHSGSVQSAKNRPGRRILWAWTPHNIPKRVHRAHHANPTVAWRGEAVLPCQSVKPIIVEAGNFRTPICAEGVIQQELLEKNTITLSIFRTR